jgi:hypothetical protein
MTCNKDCKELYSEKYDAMYCETCNKWLEDPCDDPACEFCTVRPTTPVVEN